MEKLSALITKHEDDTYSIWSVELDKADEEKINLILEKYQNEGSSVRGKIKELDLSKCL